MDALTKADPPQKPADSEGWRKVIGDGRLGEMSLEAIASALQDLGPRTDAGIRNALAKYLSDHVYKFLQKRVWTSHPNKGKEIIERTHFKIFEALGRPSCPDAVDMRTKFNTVVAYRMKDAIAQEARANRDPDEDKAHEKKKQAKARRAKGPESRDKQAEGVSDEVELEPLDEQLGIDCDGDQDDESGFRSRNQPDPALLDGVRDINEQIDVDRFLEAHVPDHRKRLAFRLFMEDVPRKSKKANSIAKAVGVDESTVREWIAEVQAELKKRMERKS